MNITLHILGTAAAVPDGPGKSYPGDIIAVYPRLSEPPSPASRLVFVHVTDCPAADIREMDFIRREAYDLDSAGQDDPPSLLHKNAWYFDNALADPAGVAALEEYRQIEITWIRAKELIKSKVTGAFMSDSDIGS